MAGIRSKRRFNFSGNDRKNIKQNAEHNLAVDHSMMIYSKNALYSFIPKNGCSTFRLSVAIENGCIDGIEDGHWIHANNRSFVASMSEAVKAEYTFVVLRCPFRRIASVFLDKFVSKEPVAWQYRNNLRREINLDDLTFRQFISHLRKTPILNSNVHWKPQNKFLLYQEYDDYFCLEEISKAIRTLSEKIDFNVVDARPLTQHGTEHFDLIDNGSFADTQAFDIATMKREGRCPIHSTLYDEELIQVVKTLYKDDFEVYTQHFGKDNLLFN